MIPNLVVYAHITLMSSGLIHPTEEQALVVNSWLTRQMIDGTFSNRKYKYGPINLNWNFQERAIVILPQHTV